jgi:hypothetical protein
MELMLMYSNSREVDKEYKCQNGNEDENVLTG